MEKRKIKLNQIDAGLEPSEYTFDLREPVFANSIMFNGEIISDLFDVGGGYVAFNIAAGKDREDFPLVLINGDIKVVSKELVEGDKIAGIGHLKKLQNQYVVEAVQVNRIPTDEEIKKLT